jgi:hypothetical protein
MLHNQLFLASLQDIIRSSSDHVTSSHDVNVPPTVRRTCATDRPPVYKRHIILMTMKVPWRGDAKDA